MTIKKILLVTDAWAPQVNGVVRLQDAYLSRLRKRGIDVTLIEPSQFPSVPMPFYPEIHLALFPRRRIARMMAEAQYDAIHIMTEGPLGWGARSVCRSKGIPFTTWYHSHFQLYLDVRLRGLLTPILFLLRRFHNAAARTIVSTESLKHTLLPVGYRTLVVVPLGVDTEHFVRNPEPSAPDFPKPVFLYFSRLATEKNPDEFFRLDLPGTKLVIGDGPERRRLEARYGATHQFAGYKRGDELVDWLSRADVFVFPSRTETFGLVSLEALACGIPVAAHPVMGPRDIVTEGKDGYLSEDLRDAALKCLTLSREDCRAKALQYSWDHSVDAFVKSLVSVS